VARQILRLLGTRYGIALALLVVVLAVIGVARVAAGPSKVDTAGSRGSDTTRSEPTRSAPAPPSTIPSTDFGSDSVGEPESPPPPSVIPGMPAPGTVAVDFAKAWIRKPGVSSVQWRKGLEPLATPRLTDLLKDTDVASVPADEIRGPATLKALGPVLAEYTIPVKPGTLRLTLVVANGRWLVDRLDWQRA
jgi:hypothetical protein